MQTAANRWRYNGFISYRRETDQPLAEALQYALERFIKPWYRGRSLRVFRDRSVLVAGEGLGANIKEALREAEFLILIASPAVAKRKEPIDWVDEELGTWLELQRERGRKDNGILLVLAGGTLAWSEGLPDVVEWSRTTALPQRLRSVFTSVPVYVDLSSVHATADRSILTRHRHIPEVAALAAALLHKRDKTEVYAEHIAQLRRNLLVAVVACVLLLATTLFAAWQWRTAQDRFDRLRGLSEATLFDLHDIVQNLPGAVEHRRSLVERTLPYLDYLYQEHPRDPGLLRNLLVGYLKVGDVQGHPEEFSLGDAAGALRSYRRALEMSDRLLRSEPNNSAYRQDRALVLERLGLLRAADGDLEGADRYYKQAAMILADLMGEEPVAWILRRDQARLQNLRGNIAMARRSPASAKSLYQNAAETVRQELTSEPSNRLLWSDLASYQEQLGAVEKAEGHPDQAGEFYEKARQIREFLKKDAPYDALNLVRLAGLHSALGDILLQQFRLDRAAEEYAKSAESLDWLHKLEPENKILHANLATDRERLGKVYHRQRHWARALDEYQKSLDLRQDLVARHPDNHEYLYHLAISQERVGDIYREWEGAAKTQEERSSRTRAYYGQSLEQRKKLLAAHPANRYYRQAVAASEQRLGRFLALDAHAPRIEALPHLQEAQTLFQELHNSNPEDATFAYDYAVNKFILADAELEYNQPVHVILPLQREGLKILEKAAGEYPDRMDIAKSLLVGYRQIGESLLQSARMSADREEIIRSANEAGRMFARALETIDSMLHRGANLPNIDEERKNLSELIQEANRLVGRGRA